MSKTRHPITTARDLTYALAGVNPDTPIEFLCADDPECDAELYLVSHFVGSPGAGTHHLNFAIDRIDGKGEPGEDQRDG
jgi:hypothetical protein